MEVKSSNDVEFNDNFQQIVLFQKTRSDRPDVLKQKKEISMFRSYFY